MSHLCSLAIGSMTEILDLCVSYYCYSNIGLCGLVACTYYCTEKYCG